MIHKTLVTTALVCAGLVAAMTLAGANAGGQADCIGKLISERATTSGAETGQFVSAEARAGLTGETVSALAASNCGVR